MSEDRRRRRRQWHADAPRGVGLGLLTPAPVLSRILLLIALASAGAASSGCAPVKRALVGTVMDSRRGDAGLKTRDVEVDGRRVAYLERPGAEPALVMLHGFGANKDVWLALAAELPPGRRLLAPDLSGHGDSERGPGPYDAPRLADEVGAWLDAVAPGPVVLAGNSLGGEIATRLALARPARTRGLVLLDPAGVASPQPAALRDSLLGGTNPLIPTTRAEFDRLVAFAYERDPGIPGPARDVLAADGARRAPFLRLLFASLQADPGGLAGRLGEIRMPALVVWGAADRVLDPSAGPVWRDALGDAELVVLPGVGHVPMMEAPEETAELVAPFLGRVAG